MAGGWVAAAIAVVVWGVTFASTWGFFVYFSTLEINIAWVALAWVPLWTDETKKCTIPINKSIQ